MTTTNAPSYLLSRTAQGLLANVKCPLRWKKKIRRRAAATKRKIIRHETETNSIRLGRYDFVQFPTRHTHSNAIVKIIAIGFKISPIHSNALP